MTASAPYMAAAADEVKKLHEGSGSGICWFEFGLGFPLDWRATRGGDRGVSPSRRFGGRLGASDAFDPAQKHQTLDRAAGASHAVVALAWMLRRPMHGPRGGGSGLGMEVKTWV